MEGRARVWIHPTMSSVNPAPHPGSFVHLDVLNESFHFLPNSSTISLDPFLQRIKLSNFFWDDRGSCLTIQVGEVDLRVQLFFN